MNNNQFTLSKFYLHFAKGNKRENDNFFAKKNRKNNKKTKLNNNYDKLFFNFLLIVKMDKLTLDYSKNSEIKFKYEIAQQMENMKFKKIENVINNLCFDDTININTLSALCCFFSKSVFYFSQNIFLTLNNEENNNENAYLVKRDLSIVYVKKETIKELQLKSFEINNVNKVFYSMSHYKLDELKEIAFKIGIEPEGKKKVIYDKISQHLSNAIF
tara:strand:- start:18 stop:662 length:645 start_codon:yes stop_codon:yes gene_type:complete